MRRLVLVLAIVVSSAALPDRAAADTIVLKNGRRIVVSSVVRENGRVSGETPAGRVSLPESLVERVEKGKSAPDPGNPDAAALNFAPGPVSDAAGTEAESAILRNGMIDADAIARIEAKTGAGTPESVRHAIAAELIASRFALGKDELDAALDHAQRAVGLAPGALDLLLNLAYVHLRRSDYTAALDDLDRARRVAPDSPDVAKLMGWANYGLNHLARAVEEWKSAQALRPEPEVADALEKAQRDLDTESSFREGQSAHFVVHYYGGAEPELAQVILHVLEDDFSQISTQLDEIPSQPISVVLYTNQGFADITRAPAWAGALNDGRIRVPVQGLVSVTPELARVLKHELAHSFVTEKTHGRSPVWLQEGVAQWVEGKRSNESAPQLLLLYDTHQEPALSTLEDSFLGMSTDFAEIAYAWSLAVVEGVEANGPGDLIRLLDHVATDHSTEAAVRSVLRMSYGELNRQTADYLRHTYPH